jgi:hypothetical protein
MSAPKWEYKRLILRVPTDSVDYPEGGGTFHYFGKAEPDGSFWMDDEIAMLGHDGWEMVAAVPLVGGRVKEYPSNNWGVSYVFGYSLWFKRPIST